MATLGQTNQPVTTVVGTTASYTVPSGRWARVLIGASSASKISSAAGASGIQTAAVPMGSSDYNEEFFLKSGDVLSSSLTNASGSVTSAGGAMQGGNSESSVSISINSTVVAVCRSPISAAVGGNGVSTGVTFTGTTSMGFIASEYLNSF